MILSELNTSAKYLESTQQQQQTILRCLRCVLVSGFFAAEFEEAGGVHSLSVLSAATTAVAFQLVEA